MCGGSPSPPPAPAVPPPVEEKKLELNPERKKSAQLKAKKAGTRQLQVPLGGFMPRTGNGLSIGGRRNGS